MKPNSSILLVVFFLFTGLIFSHESENGEKEQTEMYVVVEGSTDAVLLETDERWSRSLGGLKLDQKVTVLDKNQLDEENRLLIRVQTVIDGDTLTGWVKKAILSEEVSKASDTGAEVAGIQIAGQGARGIVVPDPNPIDFDRFKPGEENRADDELRVRVKGTGQTIGHVILLEVKNRDKNNSGKIRVTPSLVPGKGNTQAYFTTDHIEREVPPGGEITIPLEGICIDPHKPPLRNGAKGTDFEDWISVNPLPDDWEPNPTTGWEPDVGNPLLNPVTENELNHVIDIASHPEAVADLIGVYIGRIIDTYDYLSNVGEITTPLTNRPLDERNAVIQQLVWRTAAALSGDEFTQTDWGERIFDQLPDSGEDLSDEERENINAGVEDFWNTATLVGVEAKVLKEEINPNLGYRTTTSNSISPSECVSNEKSNNKDSLDIDIANTGNRSDREEYVKAFRAAVNEVSKAIADGNKSDTIDIGFSSSQMPASAFSFFISQAIGARSNGTAFMVDNQNLLSSVMTTEPVETYAEGYYRVTLSHVAGRNCRSDIIGMNMAVLQADSEVNATMNSPAVLKIINAVGEIAIDFVVARGRGTTKKLSDYLKEKLKDLPKDLAKEQMKDLLKDIHEKTKDLDEDETEDYLDDLLEELKKEDDSFEEDAVDFLAEWIAELMVEKDIKEAVGDKIISDLTPAPIDFSPIQTNTYALVEGNFEIWLDKEHQKLRTASAVQYKRESFESNEAAINGGNQYCDAGVITHKTSGQITAKTEGNSMSKAEATGQGLINTGHGRATASLESINSIFIILICTCHPGGVTYETFSSTSSYYESPFIGNIHQAVINQQMNSIVKELDNKISSNNANPANRDSLNNYIDSLEEKMKEAALAASRIIQSCQ